MKMKWNKVTWYSKLLAIILAVGIFYIGFRLGGKKTEVQISNETPIQTPPKTAAQKAVPISISTQKIAEENFTGTMAVISGPGALVSGARAYVEKTIAEFRKEANTDVPDMREKFGADSPVAKYEIDVDAKHVKSEKAESIVISVYTYTGGAHGGTLYKVISASPGSGKIIHLSDIIKSDKRSVFTEFVKKELNNWKADTDAPVVFTEEVKNLTFDSFSNWSLDGKNLTIYFDQYAIGPGYLGAVAFPLPLQKIQDFMK